MNNVIVPRQLTMDHHQSSIDVVFDDQTSQAIRDLSAQMGLAFGEFIPHATLTTSPASRLPTWPRWLRSCHARWISSWLV